MSYYCYVHNWHSPTYSCPSCVKVDYYTSDKVTIEAPEVWPNVRNDAEHLKLHTKYKELESQLHSANAKLAVAETALIKISNGGADDGVMMNAINRHLLQCELASKALKQIAEMEK